MPPSPNDLTAHRVHVSTQTPYSFIPPELPKELSISAEELAKMARVNFNNKLFYAGATIAILATIAGIAYWQYKNHSPSNATSTMQPIDKSEPSSPIEPPPSPVSDNDNSKDDPFNFAAICAETPEPPKTPREKSPDQEQNTDLKPAAESFDMIPSHNPSQNTSTTNSKRVSPIAPSGHPLSPEANVCEDTGAVVVNNRQGTNKEASTPQTQQGTSWWWTNLGFWPFSSKTNENTQPPVDTQQPKM